VKALSRAGLPSRLFGSRPDYDELHRLFSGAGANVERTTGLLLELMRKWPDDQVGRRHDIVDCEHAGDRYTHDIAHHLHTRSVTPFGGADALTLAAEIDDVVDFAEEVAGFLVLYRVEAPMDQAVRLAEVLHAAGSELAVALDKLADPAALRPHLAEITRLEEEGDRVEREALAALFEGGIDPMVVIRWKDIFERLEAGIDSCEHVANVLEGIAVKHA
jgi:uncharacterized protein Yka (UPF0111/DUF47 family)